jgi:hypothetical protein
VAHDPQLRSESLQEFVVGKEMRSPKTRGLKKIQVINFQKDAWQKSVQFKKNTPGESEGSEVEI